MPGAPGGQPLTLTGLRRAAADLLTRPVTWYGLAALFGARLGLFVVLARDRPDVVGLWHASRDFFAHPDRVYQPSAAFIAGHHWLLPPPDGPGFLGPAPQVLMGLPLAWLPLPAFEAAWLVVDAACIGVALWLLFRRLAPSPLALALGLFVTVAFPPVFAELVAAQRGGPILLLAVAAMLTAATSPGWAGAAAGIATSLKLYPLALLVGAPRRILAGTLAVVFAASWLIAFAPLGGPQFYIQHVLVPATSPSDADCAIDSVRSLWMRAVGGERYAWSAPSGLAYIASPIHLPLVAAVLTYATDLGLVAGAFWAARRVGFGTPPALALAFGLGALVPGEVYPYQFLPLLPLALMLTVGAVESRRWGVLALLGVACLGFVRPPCDTPLPNLWTLSGLAVFALGVWHHRLLAPIRIQAGGEVHGAQ